MSTWSERHDSTCTGRLWRHRRARDTRPRRSGYPFTLGVASGVTASSRTKPRSAEFVSDRRVAVRWEIARDVTFRRPVQRRRWTAFRHLAEEEVALVLHLADAIYENAPSATAVRQA